MTKEFEQIKINSICPICKKDISEIWVVKLDSIIGVRYAYICLECKSLIKITHEKYLDISNLNNFIFPN